MISRLHQPIRLTIAPAAKVYAAGDSITLRVAVVARKNVSIRSAQAGMTARIWYRTPERTRTHSFVAPPAPPPLPPPATVSGVSTNLSFPAALQAGSTLAREAVVQNWARTASGGLGRVPRIEYRLWARIVLGDGRTVSRGVPVRLVSRRALNQQVEGGPPAFRELKVEYWRHHRVYYGGDCDLRLRLPESHARPGETLSGVLHVGPHRPVDARRVVVSLHRMTVLAGSAMPSTMSNADYRGEVRSPKAGVARVKAVPLAGGASLTEPRDFPFAIQLPRDACPTILTRYLAVRWYLRGWVQDQSRQWQVFDTEINVHNAPD